MTDKPDDTPHELTAKSFAKDALSLLLKLAGVALALLLVYLTLRRTDANLLASLRTAYRPLLCLAVLMYGLVNLTASWRWGILLRVQGITIGIWQLFRLTLIGMFFSNIIPGAVSGDIYKMYYLFKKAEGKRTEALLSIVVDRYLGLFGLFVVGMLSSALLWLRYPDIISGNHLIRLSACIIWAFGIAMTLCACLAAARQPLMRIKPLTAIFDFFGRHLPSKVTKVAQDLAGAIDLYRNKAQAVFVAFLLSMAIHTMLGILIFCLGRAFHEHAMSIVQYITMTQFSNATGMVPLTPGGIGLRDTVSSVFLEEFQAAPADVLGVIPVTFTMVIMFWGLIGGIIFNISMLCRRTIPHA